MDLSNFKVLDIIERTNNTIYKCCFCEKEIERIATLKCSHYFCLDCVDTLYDLYKDKKDKDDNIMFLCPLCNEKIYVVRYN